MWLSAAVLRFGFCAFMSNIKQWRPMAIAISENVGFAESVVGRGQ